MNKIILIGYMGRNPETKYTDDGRSCTSFSVASNRRYRKADGERCEETQWFQVKTYGKLADDCKEQLTKGLQVCIEGRLSARSYMSRDKQPQCEMEIEAREVHFLKAMHRNSYDAYNSNWDNNTKDDVDDLPF